MADCIFCKIVKGEIPCYKIYEDDLVLAFLDIFPANEGHTLIIPKMHRKDIFDIEEKEIQRVVSIAKKIASKYKKVLNMDHCNIIQSSGKHANQDVFHFHMHLLPRLEDDGLHMWHGKSAKKPDFKVLQEKLKLF